MPNKKSQNQNMEPASLWNERNDAHLLSIIEDKLISIKRDIRNCERASERNRLKAKRAEYREIYTKIKNGDYCGNIILNQFLDAQEASKYAKMRQAELEAQLRDDIEKKEKKKSKKEKKQAKYELAKKKKEARFEAKYGDGPVNAAGGKKAKNIQPQPVEEKKPEKIGKYHDRFADVDFDYEGYFRKTRYYGKLAPLISLILIIAVLGIFLFSFIIPATTLESISFTTGIEIESVFAFKLGADSLDYRVPNDGNWPNGTWESSSQKPQLPLGQKYKNSLGVEPGEVFLYADLGMTSITVSSLDIFKAFFYTPLMSKTRIDPIEDLPVIANKTSWFYVKFMRDRIEDITIQKGTDGKYNNTVIMKWLATYGTIFSLMFTYLCILICLFIAIIQFFSYTSRKLHFFSFFALLSGALTLLLPALLLVEGIDFKNMSGTFEIIKNAYINYFVFDYQTYMLSVGHISIGILPLISLALLGVLLFVPVLLKNKRKLKQGFVPKGNRPHTFLRKEESNQAVVQAPTPKKTNANPGLIQLNPALLGGLTPAVQGAPAGQQAKPQNKKPKSKGKDKKKK